MKALASRPTHHARTPHEPPIEVLKEALDAVGIHIPIDVLRRSSEDEKAGLAQIAAAMQDLNAAGCATRRAIREWSGGEG